MKQKFLYLFFFCLSCLVQTQVWAQGTKGERARLTTEQRIDKQAEHVANSLMLSDEVAEQFVPIYSSYLKEFRNCAHVDFRKEFGKGKMDKNNLTDEQIDKIITLRFEKCRKILDVREKYYLEFKKILTPRQIMKLYSIEHNLTKKVQGELDRRCQNRKK